MGISDPSFGLRHRVVEGLTVLTLHGELDAWAEQELEPCLREFLDRSGSDVVVDLRQVTFLDAGGLRLLVRIRNRTAATGRALRLVRCAPRVWRVMGITRLDRSFTALDALPAELEVPDGDDVPA
ncbi:STAS domain-containing protein [Streptomyces sp. NPDC086554]|uniref:STAS domain-containing protein n=1 Tax=Streptomyces sp. NPDC086554 TaxID=3154864 RepID=UPI00342B664E